MRISIYLNKEDEIKLKEICTKYKSLSQCIKAMINERHATIHDDLLLELQTIEDKLDQCLKQKHLNRV
ncbi:hypothetical protein STIV2_B67 [Sulfolobus turreted icosahedral virus 2]|uniref:Uncharacterized protein n=1 Tax=Sulfolobus turreted icosahedral virus 2 TaxID=754004 RepID=D5IEY3_9VIRU|nr:hypothetical protein STIV2_B67 [Sulfolobus turreted icosahedral virus 2]ADF27756.1 hypothetical protein STIV2_B67 [Sulfolobus turreted icosahedral virus 2]